MAGRYTIDCEQGATWSETWTWYAGGAPVDLTGRQARMQWRDRAGTVCLEFSTAAGGITLGGVDGTITPSATPEQTALLPTAGGPLDWDLFVWVPGTGGEVRRLLEGDVRVRRRVTQ